MIKTLVSQGWSKNEIIYETQRIFGNDVFISPEELDDERSFIGKVVPIVVPALILAGFFFTRRKIHT